MIHWNKDIYRTQGCVIAWNRRFNSIFVLFSFGFVQYFLSGVFSSKMQSALEWNIKLYSIQYHIVRCTYNKITIAIATDADVRFLISTKFIACVEYFAIDVIRGDIACVCSRSFLFPYSLFAMAINRCSSKVLVEQQKYIFVRICIDFQILLMISVIRIPYEQSFLFQWIRIRAFSRFRTSATTTSPYDNDDDEPTNICKECVWLKWTIKKKIEIDICCCWLPISRYRKVS